MLTITLVKYYYPSQWVWFLTLLIIQILISKTAKIRDSFYSF